MSQRSKRILVVTPHYPLPEGMGVERRAYQHVRGLSCRFTIDLVILYECAHAIPTDFQDLAETVVELKLPDNVARLPHWASRLPLLTLMRELLVDSSKRARPISSRQAQQQLAAIADRTYATAVFLRIRSWVFHRALHAAGVTWERSIVDFDDIESKRNLRIAERLRRDVGREVFWVARLRAWRLARYEQQVLGEVDIVLLCSAKDRDEVAAMSTRAQVIAVPNAVPVTQPLPADPHREVNILFVGTMGYQPNADGAVFFCREVLPTLRASCTHPVVVWLVGYDPAPRVRALDAELNVIVTGSVPSVEPFYRAADLCIAPIRSGGGTRIKILEALAHGRPLVSTTLGIEGIDVTPDEHYLLADDAPGFAEACARLITDAALRDRLVANAFTAVKARYAYESVWRTLERLVDRFPQKGQQRDTPAAAVTEEPLSVQPRRPDKRGP